MKSENVIIIHFPYHETVLQSIQEGIEYAKKFEKAIKIIENGITIFLKKDSDPNLINTEYQRVFRSHINEVGPYPTTELNAKKIKRGKKN